MSFFIPIKCYYCHDAITFIGQTGKQCRLWIQSDFKNCLCLTRILPHCGILLCSLHRTLRIYRVGSLHPPRHHVVTAVLRTAIKETHCMLRLKKFVGADYMPLVRVTPVRVTVSPFEKTREMSSVTFYFLMWKMSTAIRNFLLFTFRHHASSI